MCHFTASANGPAFSPSPSPINSPADGSDEPAKSPTTTTIPSGPQGIYDYVAVINTNAQWYYIALFFNMQFEKISSFHNLQEDSKYRCR